MTRFTCYAQTMPGIEPVAWLEIRQRLARARLMETLFAREKNGIVVFEFDDALAQTHTLRCVEDVFLLVQMKEHLSRDWKDLRELARDIEYGHILDEALKSFRSKGKGMATFRVVARKEGQHSYRRIDLEQAVQQAVTNAYPRQLQFKAEDADIEIWVNALGSILLCGLRLTDRTMRHRDYKTAHVAASLRPSVAAAMVLLTEPTPDDVFLEPMCGAGTIVAERLAFDAVRQLFAGDIAPQMLTAARKNVPREATRRLMRWDAMRLPIASSTINKSAVNLPFGKKIATKQEIARLYPAFFREVERVLAPGGICVALTSEYELMRQTLREAPSLAIDRGYSVAILGEWSRVYIVRRVG
jgi:23S rRNA G2445 N2-methylase RlmL